MKHFNTKNKTVTNRKKIVEDPRCKSLIAKAHNYAAQCLYRNFGVRYSSTSEQCEVYSSAMVRYLASEYVLLQEKFDECQEDAEALADKCAQLRESIESGMNGPGFTLEAYKAVIGKKKNIFELNEE